MTKPTYEIDAKPTIYNNILYRSRLEARWAAFFDLIRFEYEYEPEPFKTWSPDFTIHTLKAFVEVKPYSYWTEELMAKIGPYSKEHLCGLLADDIVVEENAFYLGKWFNRDPKSNLLLKDITIQYYDRFNKPLVEMLWAEAKNKVMYLKPRT